VEINSQRMIVGTTVALTDLELSCRTSVRVSDHRPASRIFGLANVFANGKSAGILWKSPFRDITDRLRPGANRLSVRVTKLWPNHLIGNRPALARPIAFTTFNPYSADSALLDSGLPGPASILRVTTGGSH
jgi:hypothetical protein